MKLAVKSHQPPLIDWSLNPAPAFTLFNSRVIRHIVNHFYGNETSPRASFPVPAEAGRN